MADEGNLTLNNILKNKKKYFFVHNMRGSVFKYIKSRRFSYDNSRNYMRCHSLLFLLYNYYNLFKKYY